MVATRPVTTSSLRRHKFQGLLAGALVGWALVTARMLVWPALVHLGDPSFVDMVRQLQSALAVMIVFGIPIAMIAAFFVGWPMWGIADRLNATRAWHGLMFGAATGAVIIAGSTVLEIVGGAVSVLNSNGSSSYGDGGGALTINGLPTAHGWRTRALDLLYYAFAGSVAGLVAWKVARPNTSRVAD